MTPRDPEGKLAARARFGVAGFAVIALVAAQWVLSQAIHATNYSGGDGKMAQATILTAFKFAKFLHVTTFNPLQGLGSQLLPMNVWANPVYWPFAVLRKELATDVSAAMALGIFVIAGYLMARCFDVPVVPSAIGAQLSIIVFAPIAFVLQLSTVFCIMTGNAVVYAPHMLALGLLARLEAGSWRAFGLTTAGIFALLFYSLVCDPLWSVVHGVGWAASFAVVALGRLHVKTILVRCVALGCCGVLFLLSGAAEYVRTLTRYTARIQFPGAADRATAPDFLASQLFYSPYVKYFYLVWALGWLLGILTLAGRARLLVVTGMASGLFMAVYTGLYLLLNAPWQVPLPVYLEHGLFPLFTISAVVGYWGLLRIAARVARHASDGRWQLGPVSRGWSRARRWVEGDRPPGLSRRPLVTAAGALIAVAIIPVVVTDFAIRRGPTLAEQYHERWPHEPELAQFLTDRVGLGGNRPLRGSVQFWPFEYGTGLTVSGLWAGGVPTVVQYNQLITPPSYYFAHAISKLPAGTIGGNGFIAVPGASWEHYWRVLQVLGARYHVAPNPLPSSFPVRTFPYRPLVGQHGLWYVYEIPHPNIGNYSPTELTLASSGAEIAAVMTEPDFDFTRRAVLSAPIAQPLVAAREMRVSPIRGGLHVSGHSDGTSLVVLPQQFSHCLRPRDARVRLVRVDLILTGMVFSRDVDTDIVFDYGIFTPRCRAADLADLRQLDLRLSIPRSRATGGPLFPGWRKVLAMLAASARAVK